MLVPRFVVFGYKLPTQKILNTNGKQKTIRYGIYDRKTKTTIAKFTQYKHAETLMELIPQEMIENPQLTKTN